MFSRLREKITSIFKGKKHRERNYISPMNLDITLAIQELNTIAQDDSDAIELYIALASLYRTQGNIEKALQIHARLLVRSDITHSTKARLYAELGRDYKYAGILDRAVASYLQAKDFGYTDERFFDELIEIYSTLQDYEKAVSVARSSKDSLSESYYLIQQYRKQNALIPLTKQQITKTIEISPELAEGWVLLLCLYSTVDTLDEFRSTLTKALNYVPIPFLLFEGYLTSGTFQNLSIEEKTTFVTTIAILIEEYGEDFLLLYYLGISYRMIEDRYHAIQSFERSLSLNNEFWATQYELFSLALPSFKQNDILMKSAYFLSQFGFKINRFACSLCEFEDNTAFSLCPRCHHIQTIYFRTML